MIDGDKELAAQSGKSRAKESVDHSQADEHGKAAPEASGKAVLKGVPYQRAGQVRQALNERRTAKAHGNHERVKAADKHLDALDYDGDPEAETTDARGPVGRSTHQRSQVTTDAPVPRTPPHVPPSGPHTPPSAPRVSQR